MAVSNRLRFEILRRDGFACRYCGTRADAGAVLEIDHVLPKILGGTDKPTNLVSACTECNSGKTSTHPGSPGLEDVDENDLRWARAVKRAAARMAADIDARNDLHRQFESAWDRFTYEDADGEQQRVPKDQGWRKSVDELTAAGLTLPMLSDCIDQAMAARSPLHKIRFCRMVDLAWGKVADLRKRAVTMMGDDSTDDDVDEYDAQEMAKELLEYLDDNERERILDRFREDYQADAVEILALEDVFPALINERLNLTVALQRLLEQHPAEQVTAARAEAVNAYAEHQVHATEGDLLSHMVYSIVAYPEAVSYLGNLPKEQRDGWIDYVTAWPECPADQQAMAIRAADIARRSEHGDAATLRGMCQGGDPTHPSGRCQRVATHTLRIEECLYCTKRKREVCAGKHGSCELHLERLVAGEMTYHSTGEPIRVSDFAELAACA